MNPGPALGPAEAGEDGTGPVDDEEERRSGDLPKTTMAQEDEPGHSIEDNGRDGGKKGRPKAFRPIAPEHNLQPPAEVQRPYDSVHSKRDSQCSDPHPIQANSD